MTPLIFGSGLFILAIILQIIMWRIRLPKSPIRAILILFSTIFVIGVLTDLYLHIWSGGSSSSLLSIGDWVRLLLLYTSLTFTYCFVYHSLDDDSPSLFIALNIWSSGKQGITKDELYSLMPNDNFFRKRVDYLVEEGMASIINKKYVITRKGRSILRLFSFINQFMRQNRIQG